MTDGDDDTAAAAPAICAADAALAGIAGGGSEFGHI